MIINIVDNMTTKRYGKSMRVISKKTLKEFYENPLYKDSKSSL